jgi:uncharacterized protein (DUF1499 family)
MMMATTGRTRWAKVALSLASCLLLSPVCHSLGVSRRRTVLLWIGAGAAVVTPGAATAAETIGKADDCNTPYCLGVWDGLLADCHPDHDKNCVSSQDDTPRVFMEPWDYSEATTNGATTTPGSILNQILTVLQTTNGGGGTSTKLAATTASLALQRILYIGNRKIMEEATTTTFDSTIIRDQDRYLRVEFVDGGMGEFYVTPDDTTVQFRLAGGGNVVSNRQRAETIRKALRFEKLIVLRNRRRTLLFVESDRFDTFGPRFSSPSAMMLGPPALDENDSIDRRQLNDNNDPGQEITQQFPRMKGRRL